jgi:hypothetical protein
LKPPGGPIYLLGQAATPGAAETRQFLSRNGVSFSWVDVDDDPLMRVLAAAPALATVRLPCVLFPDGTILEGPGRLTADQLEARLAGSGDMQLGHLAARSVTASVLGSGRLDVQATQKLDASISGSGAIIYSGHPATLTQTVNGSGANPAALTAAAGQSAIANTTTCAVVA